MIFSVIFTILVIAGAKNIILTQLLNLWQQFLFLKMGQIRPLFVYFRCFHMTNIAQIDYKDKSIHGVLWT